MAVSILVGVGAGLAAGILAGSVRPKHSFPWAKRGDVIGLGRAAAEYLVRFSHLQ